MRDVVLVVSRRGDVGAIFMRIFPRPVGFAKLYYWQSCLYNNVGFVTTKLRRLSPRIRYADELIGFSILAIFCRVGYFLVVLCGFPL